MVKKTCTLDPKLLAAMETELRMVDLDDLVVRAPLSSGLQSKERAMTPLEELLLLMLLKQHGRRQVGVDANGHPIWCPNPGWSDARARDLLVLMVQAVRDNPQRFFPRFTEKAQQYLLGLGLIEPCPDDAQSHQLTNEGERVMRELRRTCINKLESCTSPSGRAELVKDIEFLTTILDEGGLDS
jgi:hypothetical protein